MRPRSPRVQSTLSGRNKKRRILTVKEIVLFAMLGALMVASKYAMEFLPNVHMLGAFIVSETVVFRKKALYPVYIFVFLIGLFNGFALWWVPYLYIWAVLWGAVMLLPRRIPQKAKPFVYAGVSALHGLLYGTLYAPMQCLLFGTPLRSIPAWILAGLPWDCVHAAGNLAIGFLIVPMIFLLEKAKNGVGAG